jgi:hypothetical protein
MGELKNYILKTEGDYIKKTKVYQLYSDMLSLNKIISRHKQLSMPGDFGKMQKYVEWG